MAYAELVCRSNFTFLEGASHPEELVLQAHALGLQGLALTDRDSLGGVVRAHVQAKKLGLHLLIGVEVTFLDAPPLVLLAQDFTGYRNLCQLVSIGRAGVEKGRSLCPWDVVPERTAGLLALDLLSTRPEHLQKAKAAFGDRLHLAVWHHLTHACEDRNARRKALSAAAGVPLVVTNAPVQHVRDRQRLQDVVTCIREGITVHEAGTLLYENAERIVKPEQHLRRIWYRDGKLLDRAAELAAACHFTLDEIKHHFPTEMMPAGAQPMDYLRHLTWEGLADRYPNGVPESVRAQTNHELALVEELGYAGYFLTVWDIVRFARGRGILCQGRGSAANSVVCYALGITSIDPVRMGLLFERFISRERNEPPDIDVDFEHERREEVLQYVYVKYGRDKAAMVSEVICYRGRSALREVGKALGLSLDQVDVLAKTAGSFDRGPNPESLRHSGLNLEDRAVRDTLELAEQLQDFPRHLSIHSGGFVVTKEMLASLVPIENGAMQDRTVIQWDKDDAAAVGLLKIDLLSLGMLSMLARAFELIRKLTGRSYDLATIPAEDPAVYDMLCEADSVGVFQIESRAQMNMLPRLKPRCFYDLVIEVAIIRPGPIQGGMVHPYLKRRAGIEEVIYPHPAVQDVLEKTLGVTLFQEQGMKLAVAAAGFTPGEADELRRAMTHKRSKERLEEMRGRLVAGMAANGIGPEVAENIFQQLLGFSGYGFPESHAASFALLVYASAWLKRHYPGVFAACLLNAQPMGFYAPHTIIEDARRHAVPSRPIDVFFSDWETALEPGEPGEGLRPEDRPWARWQRRRTLEPPVALRLGLKELQGLRREHADAVVNARKQKEFRSIEDFARRTALPRHVMAKLAAAGALAGFGFARREALWHVQGLIVGEDLFAGLDKHEPRVTFDEGTKLERVARDYRLTGFSAESHPMALLRPRLQALGLIRSDKLDRSPRGRRVKVGGMVIIRQRPGTAKGIVFITIEDESGFMNLVVMPDLWERDRHEGGKSLFLGAEGIVERAGRVATVKVERLFALDLQDNPLEPPGSRDFR